jgi:hypothetical protein
VAAVEKYNSSITVTYICDHASKSNVPKEITSHLYDKAFYVSSYNREMLISFLDTFKHTCNCESSEHHHSLYIHTHTRTHALL